MCSSSGLTGRGAVAAGGGAGTGAAGAGGAAGCAAAAAAGKAAQLLPRAEWQCCLRRCRHTADYAYREGPALYAQEGNPGHGPSEPCLSHLKTRWLATAQCSSSPSPSISDSPSTRGGSPHGGRTQRPRSPSLATHPKHRLATHSLLCTCKLVGCGSTHSEEIRCAFINADSKVAAGAVKLSALRQAAPRRGFSWSEWGPC